MLITALLEFCLNQFPKRGALLKLTHLWSLFTEPTDAETALAGLAVVKMTSPRESIWLCRSERGITPQIDSSDWVLCSLAGWQSCWQRGTCVNNTNSYTSFSHHLNNAVAQSLSVKLTTNTLSRHVKRTHTINMYQEFQDFLPKSVLFLHTVHEPLQQMLLDIILWPSASQTHGLNQSTSQLSLYNTERNHSLWSQAQSSKFNFFISIE